MNITIYMIAMYVSGLLGQVVGAAEGAGGGAPSSYYNVIIL